MAARTTPSLMALLIIRMSDPELTREAIDITGLAARRFAVEVIGVNERSVRRWIAGDSPIQNSEDRAWLEAFVALWAARPAIRRQLK